MSLGIKVYGFLSIIYSLYILNFVFFYLRSVDMFSAAYLATGACWTIFGISVIKQRSWGRAGLIFLASIYLYDYHSQPSKIFSAIKHHDMWFLTQWIVGSMFFISLIVYFTRPAVKLLFIEKSEMKPELNESKPLVALKEDSCPATTKN